MREQLESLVKERFDEMTRKSRGTDEDVDLLGRKVPEGQYIYGQKLYSDGVEVWSPVLVDITLTPP